ncbi:MAG: rod shape-determining protein MreC [Candidatus Omnitrophica bacterium]|nr:rod shape-determining protein MreC [Candidatus Omnitrophota bacterium]
MHHYDYKQIISENKKLTEENIKLRLENWQLNHLRLENQQLRSLLEFKKNALYSAITGEVIGFDYSENRKIIFVDLGFKEGVYKEMVCLNSAGLIGKVIEVGESISKIMCINDPNSRVPAMTEDTQEIGLVYGTMEGDKLQMKFISSESKTKIGAVVVTSGLGNIYPKGIVIGEIKDIINYGFYKTAIIKPKVNFLKPRTVILLKQK